MFRTNSFGDPAQEDIMRIACHFTIPRPPYLQADAAIQDGLEIVSALNGEINFLYPGKKATKFFPRFLSGFHQLPNLGRIDREVDVHHIFTNGFYPYPIYSFFRKPLVVSTVISLDEDHPISFPVFMKNVRLFLVPTMADLKIMEKWGFENVRLVMPGINISRIKKSSPCPTTKKRLILLVGSAPWNSEQFRSKGVMHLLEVMQEIPWLELVFLWRGVMKKEMSNLIDELSLSDRVTIIDRYVDINEVLEKVHASIVLAENKRIVKPYPHSLLETLLAGKPVIISGCLGLSEFVQRYSCGVIVSDLKNNCLKESIKALQDNYGQYYAQLRAAPVKQFSSSRMLEELKAHYTTVID